jgi:hypothetical protein
VEWFSVWAAVSSTFVVSLLALFVYFASAPLFRAPLRQGILAGSLVLLPVLSVEVLGALCNLQWILPIACLFAVLFPVDGWGGIAVRVAIVVLAPLSSPLSLLVAPTAIYQIVMFARRRGDRRRCVVPVVYLSACVGQLVVYLSAEHRPLNDAVQPPLGAVADDMADLYNLGVLIFGGVDTEASRWLWRSSSSWLGWVAAGFVLALVLVKLVRAQATARWWIAGFAVASPAVFVFTMVQRSERVAPSLALESYDSRYWVVPQLLLLIALLVPPVVDRGLLLGRHHDAAVTPSAPRDGGRSNRWGALTGGLPSAALMVLTVAWLAVAVVPSYRHDVRRSELPSWPDAIDSARAACRIDPTTPKTIGVVPPHWRLQMTCEELDAGRPSQ